MKFDITNRFTGSVIFTAEIEATDETPLSIKLGLAVKVAVKSSADLRGAHLSSANLSSAYLRGANLSNTDLRGADLSSADLSSADLSSADLRGANLRGADLSSAYLRGANLSSADLSSANLRGAKVGGLKGIDVPLVKNIDVKILAAIEENKARGTNGLDMWSWHGDESKATPEHWCETTHCRAGYAICMAGKAGFELEAKVGPSAAGALIYLRSTPNEPVPDFGATNENAMKDMRERAARQLAKAGV